VPFQQIKLLAFTAIILALFISPVCGITLSEETESYYNERGLSSFNEGFYKLLPRGMKEAAAIEFEDAIGFFKKALEIKGDFTEARRNLARVYCIREDYARAVEEYKKVVNRTPDDMDARLAMASAYAKMGRPDEAIEELTIARDMNDNPIVIDKLDRLIESINSGK